MRRGILRDTKPPPHPKTFAYESCNEKAGGDYHDSADPGTVGWIITIKGKTANASEDDEPSTHPKAAEDQAFAVTNDTV